MIPADPLAARVPPLTRDPQFLKYWLSETIGEMGAAVAGLAGGPGAVAGVAAGHTRHPHVRRRAHDWVTQVLTGVARLALPLATLSGSPFLVLAAGEFALGVVRSIFNITRTHSLRGATGRHSRARG